MKTFAITEKTGRLVAIKNVTDDNDLMIINKSGIAIRLGVAEVRVMGRATQGVRLINLAKKNDVIASVCKVMSSEFEATLEEKNREQENAAADTLTNPTGSQYMANGAHDVNYDDEDDDEFEDDEELNEEELEDDVEEVDEEPTDDEAWDDDTSDTNEES